MNNLLLTFSIIPFYLIGSFPSGMLIAKLHGIDLTNSGSKNVGATNVTRLLGLKPGLLTLIADTLKGALAVFLAGIFTSSNPSFMACAGVAVVLGHCFSIPGLWKGGKGVASALGVLIALDPISSVFALTVFITILLWKEIVSLASVCAVISAPIIGLLRNIDENYLTAIAIIAGLVVVRHRENLNRLVLGTEKKFEIRKKKEITIA